MRAEVTQHKLTVKVAIITTLNITCSNFSNFCIYLTNSNISEANFYTRAFGYSSYFSAFYIGQIYWARILGPAAGAWSRWARTWLCPGAGGWTPGCAAPGSGPGCTPAPGSARSESESQTPGRGPGPRARDTRPSAPPRPRDMPGADSSTPLLSRSYEWRILRKYRVVIHVDKINLPACSHLWDRAPGCGPGSRRHPPATSHGRARRDSRTPPSLLASPGAAPPGRSEPPGPPPEPQHTRDLGHSLELPGRGALPRTARGTRGRRGTCGPHTWPHRHVSRAIPPWHKGPGSGGCSIHHPEASKSREYRRFYNIHYKIKM